MSDDNRKMKEEDMEELNDTHGLRYEITDICGICWDNIITDDDKEDVTVTCAQCCHVFHYSCFLRWLMSRSLPVG